LGAILLGMSANAAPDISSASGTFNYQATVTVTGSPHEHLQRQGGLMDTRFFGQAFEGASEFRGDLHARRMTHNPQYATGIDAHLIERDRGYRLTR